MKKKIITVGLIALVLGACTTKHYYSSLDSELYGSYASNIKSVQDDPSFSLPYETSITMEYDEANNESHFFHSGAFDAENSSINLTYRKVSYSHEEHIIETEVRTEVNGVKEWSEFSYKFIKEVDGKYYYYEVDALTDTYVEYDYVELAKQNGYREDAPYEVLNSLALLKFETFDYKRSEYLDLNYYDYYFEQFHRPSKYEWAEPVETRSIGGKNDTTLQIYYLDEYKLKEDDDISYRTVQSIHHWIDGYLIDHFAMNDEYVVQPDGNIIELYDRLEENFTFSSASCAPDLKAFTQVTKE